MIKVYTKRPMIWSKKRVPRADLLKFELKCLKHSQGTVIQEVPYLGKLEVRACSNQLINMKDRHC